jgi:hypothetical protein
MFIFEGKQNEDWVFKERSLPILQKQASRWRSLYEGCPISM